MLIVKKNKYLIYRLYGLKNKKQNIHIMIIIKYILTFIKMNEFSNKHVPTYNVKK